MSVPPSPARKPPAPAPTVPKPPRFRVAWWVTASVAALLLINYWAASMATHTAARVRVPYNPVFLQDVRAGKVKEIVSKGTAIQGTFKQAERYGTSKPTTRFSTEIPAFANTDQLSQLLQNKKVTINAQPLQKGAPWWESLLIGFGPTILLVGLLVWISRRAGNMQNVLGAFGRSSARRYAPTGDQVTFKDVAGIDEAKEELTQIVDFLRNPDKYRRLGGRIPHGVLLSGPPGTGKTLLARAVAGEADVPFSSRAASESVEAIVFIDELDAVGRSRTSGVAGFSGGNDEREQTLNQ